MNANTALRRTHLTNNEIDARATQWANAAIDGTMTETEVRWLIANDLAGTDIAFTVSRSRRQDATTQERDDLVAELLEMIEVKCLQDDGKGLDLARTAKGQSACGWARELAKAVMASELRNIRRIGLRNAWVDPTLDLGSAEGGVSYAQMAFHTASDTPDFDASLDGSHDADEELDDIHESFLEEAAGKRSNARLALAAKALRKAFALPELIRPSNPFDREWIRNAVTEDRDAARQSVAAMHALYTSVQTPEQRATDMRLLAVWDDYTAEQLAKLMGLGADAAQVLVLAAVALQPRPSRDQLTLSLFLLSHFGPQDDAEWEKFHKALFESWVATEVEATSEFSSRAPTEKAVKARLEAALSWPERAAQAIALPGSPLGDTERAVAMKIGEAVGIIIEG
ncbi:hypothetical protein [Curtobacterium sp. MCBD17_040]|uniref:hypothetical protein n=1 Tax=Curtobacterium sp. MCBD17_040 TaxID=2175674 RepID=UPI000DA8A907|nr:hypothetical protein [Curtobacterium sp. MCBD17_040]WIB65597.1 hypothetical protein DEI94_19680 [Curtobacterium sp. MCBD17_040]